MLILHCGAFENEITVLPAVPSAVCTYQVMLLSLTGYIMMQSRFYRLIFSVRYPIQYRTCTSNVTALFTLYYTVML